MSATDAALAAKTFLSGYFGNKSASSKAFYDRNVSILTGYEATEVLGYASIALLVVTFEGMYDWPSEFIGGFAKNFPELQMENINGWALGIYAADKTPLNIPKA